MVVFHSIYSIWHGPPLSYLHGKKLRKHEETDANISNEWCWYEIVRIFWKLLVFLVGMLLRIVCLVNNTKMNIVCL